MQGAFAAQAESTIVKNPYNVSAENKSFFYKSTSCTRMDNNSSRAEKCKDVTVIIFECKWSSNKMIKIAEAVY